MPFPLPEPMPVPQVSIIGDVEIHPTAAIAPGVLLQANPGSRIVIGAGVCLGMGTVVHADGGLLEIQAGATLGSGVLLVGTGVVGAAASIGSTATLVNPAVAGGQLVPPGMLLGPSGRVPEEKAPETAPPAEADPVPPAPQENGAAPGGNGAIAQPGKTVYGLDSFNNLVSALFPHRQTQEGG